MKCQHANCGGSMIYEKGNVIDPGGWKCLSCGRSPINPQPNSIQEGKKMETKVCIHKKCGKELPLTSFSINRAYKDGHENWCKDCKKQAQAAYRRKRGIQPLKSRRRKLVSKSPDPAPVPTVGEITPEILFAAVRKAIIQEIIDHLKEKFQIQ